MLVFDFFCLCERVGVVRHSMAKGIVDSLVFWENFVKLFEIFEDSCFHIFS